MVSNAVDKITSDNVRRGWIFLVSFSEMILLLVVTLTVILQGELEQVSGGRMTADRQGLYMGGFVNVRVISSQAKICSEDLFGNDRFLLEITYRGFWCRADL